MPASVAAFFSDLLSFAVSARTLDSDDSSGYSSNHPTCVNRGVFFDIFQCTQMLEEFPGEDVSSSSVQECQFFGY